MNVLLVDDHVLFRNGLILLLDGLKEGGIAFREADSVAAADTGEPADLILLDLHLRATQGTDALAEARTKFPSATIVVVSGVEDPALIRRCIDLGASGFIPKSSTQSVLISALRLVLAGGVYLPPLVLTAAPELKSPDHPPVRRGTQLAGLSQRQLEVLRMAITGKSNKVIAREMDLAEGTVKQHLSASYRAMGVSNRTEAVYRAAEMGIEFDAGAMPGAE